MKQTVTLRWGGEGGPCSWRVSVGLPRACSLSVSVMKKFRYSLSFLKGVNEIKECKVYLLMLMVQSRLSFLRTAPVCKIPLIGQPLPPGHFGFFGALRGDARPLRVCCAGSVVTQRLWLRPCPCAGPRGGAGPCQASVRRQRVCLNLVLSGGV